MQKKLTCFKAYDIRGQLGHELNEEICYRIGRAYAEYLKPRRVVVGGDIRLTSESLKQAVSWGLMDGGADVIDIGMTGTEEVYFGAFHLDVDGGIQVTASHNPIDFNGMKLVARGAQPISGDSGLKEIQRIAEAEDFAPVLRRGHLSRESILDAYVNHLLSYVNPSQIKPLKLVVNAGNGAAGHVIDALEMRFAQVGVPIQFIKVHHAPDGTFPNGIPNPLLPESRADTANAVRHYKADFGIAWDGDFDRCFLFDENGEFIEGYYIVGLLAAAFLEKSGNNRTKKGVVEKIIHDPRLTWNTIDMVKAGGGVPIQSKTGHAFIKERMRQEDAIYGGEMSAHHYFRDFAYCDSGMIPWLLVAELVSVRGESLSSLVEKRIAAFPSSGEVNFKVSNTSKVIDAIRARYEAKAIHRDETDGLSLEFRDWRFNLRASNTEPLLRLNVESRGNGELMKAQFEEIRSLILSV